MDRVMAHFAKRNQVGIFIVAFVLVAMMNFQPVPRGAGGPAKAAFKAVSFPDRVALPLVVLGRVWRDATLPLGVFLQFPELCRSGATATTEDARQSRRGCSPYHLSARGAWNLETLQDRAANSGMRQPVRVFALVAAKRPRVFEQLRKLSGERCSAVEARSLSHVSWYRGADA